MQPTYNIIKLENVFIQSVNKVNFLGSFDGHVVQKYFKVCEFVMWHVKPWGTVKVAWCVT